MPPHRYEDGTWALNPEGRDRFVRAYEAWLNDRVVFNPRRGVETLWRRVVEDDALALADALINGHVFHPYVMKY
jgi:hypothetical protein